MIQHWNNPFSRFIWKTGLAKYINYRTSINFYGVKQKIPVIASLGGRNLIPDEYWMVDLFNKKPQLTSGTVVDIGSNIGQTLLRLRASNPSSHWIGVEPNPICNYYLGKLIQANKFKNCRVLPVGFSEQINLIEFIKTEEMDPTGSIVDHFDRKGQEHVDYSYIPSFTGDYMKEIIKNETISCIKIDVEGAESLVLKGIKDLIKDLQCPIICEVLDASTENKLDWIKQRNDSIKESLESIDYKLTRIIKTPHDTFDHLEELDSIDVRMNDELTDSRRDYMFLPKDYIF